MGERIAAIVLAAAVVAAGVTAVAHATFTSSVTAAQQIATARLDPPAAPGTAAGTCAPNEADAIVVSWTATPSTWAAGYEVLRATDANGPFAVVAAVSGHTTTQHEDTGLAFGTSYYYRVRATKAAWTSADTATVSQVTRSSTCA